MHILHIQYVPIYCLYLLMVIMEHKIKMMHQLQKWSFMLCVFFSILSLYLLPYCVHLYCVNPLISLCIYALLSLLRTGHLQSVFPVPVSSSFPILLLFLIMHCPALILPYCLLTHGTDTD